MKKLIYLSLIIISIIYSCKKDDPNPDDNNGVTPAMARDSLYYIMQEWYYWNEVMPDVNKENYADPYLLLDAMRYNELDRWSFIEDYDDFIAQMSGSFVGHGFRIGLDDAGKARIAMIYEKSPLWADSVRRGWIVESINGANIAQILLAGDAATYSSTIGPSEAGVTNTFVFRRPDGTLKTVASTKKSFQVNTVLLKEVLNINGKPTGHLVFESFINPSRDELAQAFALFKSNNVEDLIVDLRYNGGGYFDIAQTLASYIGGNSLAGTIFGKMQYNQLHPEQNSEYPFLTTPYSLNLQRVVFITTRGTASASEAVMNGLIPHIIK